MAEASDHSNSQKQQNIGHIIQNIASVSGVVASFSILASFVYDWGFFYALGISFNEAPTTISDHVQSWLMWLPRVIIIVIVVTAYGLVIRRIEHGMSEEEILESARNPSLTRRIRNSPLVLFKVLGPFGVVIWVLLGANYVPTSLLFIGGAITWLLISSWIFRHPRVKALYSKLFFLSFISIPPLIMVGFSLGYSAGFAESEYNASIGFSVHGSNSVPTIESRRIKLVRSYENWLLIRDKKNRINWIKMNNVNNLVKLKEKQPFSGLICKFFTQMCPQKMDNLQNDPSP